MNKPYTLTIGLSSGNDCLLCQNAITRADPCFKLSMTFKLVLGASVTKHEEVHKTCATDFADSIRELCKGLAKK